MNIAQIESNLQKLIKTFAEKTFIYDLLRSYDLPKASITRLRKGSLNLSKKENEIVWKKKLLFRVVKNADLHCAIDDLMKKTGSLKHSPRFIIVTDYKTLLAFDTQTEDTLDIQIGELPKHYDFFLPWAGMEKAQHQNENPADVKAAERMAKLFDAIKKDNPDESSEFIHSLNVFLSRLLFCFFAEDTNIFEENQVTNSIDTHTQTDGSDLNIHLDKLFDALNTPKNKRQNLPAWLKAFPYVNGGLFREKHLTPIFTRRSRKTIIESGKLDWAAINPDIFGSMMQAVVTPEHRGSLGMHYTSVPNIMKVIEPLFLNNLYEAFEKCKGNVKKLNKLLDRIGDLKIFDPACGSGNFLIIAYKELRKLEMKILKKGEMMPISSISLSQFYGMELDDFAHEIARLSLWLAEHQMNVEFFKKFGKTNPTLPLKDAGHIVHGNATRLDWEDVCPKKKGDEIYILGNPPYLGARLQDKDQKADLAFVFKGVCKYNNLDYISGWFYKGAKYISNANAKYSFVSTNSICQGEQVALLWPYILKMNLEIFFAHQSFKWKNNAKNNAGVIVVIVGLSNISKEAKNLYSDSVRKEVKGINAYLVEGGRAIVTKQTKPISEVPKMSFGSMPNDGGHFLLSEEEYLSIKHLNPKIDKFIRVMYGGQDFLRGIKRYCLWVNENNLNEAKKIEFIYDRIQAVRKYRNGSKRQATKKLASIAYRFGEIRHHETELIVIPATSSERRTYIPIGFLSRGTIVNNSTQAIYYAEPWLLGIISSMMHMTWVRAVAGRLKTDYRYSSALCYNTFPFPDITDLQKEELTKHTLNILTEREKHSGKTLSQLYDPDKMPKGLREAHHENDLAVERCYRSKPFESDEERLEYLFKLYEKMVAEEKIKSDHFQHT